MKNNKFKILIFFSIAVLTAFGSCASRKEMIYLNSIENKSTIESKFSYDLKIKEDDMLKIVISSENPEIAIPYNTISSAEGNNAATAGYLVSKDGYITMPILGQLKVAGLNREELVLKIKNELKDAIKNPTIDVQILNFKISVLGEVLNPGQFTVNGNRISVFDALSLAGDLTIFGKRKDILIIRENDGVKTFIRIDITNPDFINSPYYYLTQNDVVYIEPNKAKISSGKINPNLSIAISATSLVITIIALLSR